MAALRSNSEEPYCRWQVPRVAPSSLKASQGYGIRAKDTGPCQGILIIAAGKLVILLNALAEIEQSGKASASFRIPALRRML